MSEQQQQQQQKVNHEYHDYAGYEDTDEGAVLDSSLSSGSASASARSYNGQGAYSQQQISFPLKLHYMLFEIEKDDLTDIISWQPHGRCFVVHDRARFVEDLLGSWFRMHKIASFQRQLNLYGFKRISSGPDRGGYYHELFLRQKPNLAQRIQLVRVKGKGMRNAASPETEPLFYSMQFLPQNPRPLPPREDNPPSPPRPCGSTASAAPLLVTSSAAEVELCNRLMSSSRSSSRLIECPVVENRMTSSPSTTTTGLTLQGAIRMAMEDPTNILLTSFVANHFRGLCNNGAITADFELQRALLPMQSLLMPPPPPPPLSATSTTRSSPYQSQDHSQLRGGFASQSWL